MSESPIIRNRLRQRLDEGAVALCIGLRQARTPDIGQMAAACGFDALYVDMEHSTISLDATSAICNAAKAFGVTPIVRPPSHGADWISRVLDGGAQGILVPHVNSAAEAAAIVRAARFPPIGHRSVMGVGPGTEYRALPLGEVNDRLNAETFVIAMLETPEGIAAADVIAATPGVDMLLIGSNDLCTEMGIPGQIRHPRLREAYETAAAACRAHRKVLGVGGIRGDAELHRDLVALGARFVIAGTDVGYLMAGARADVAALRKTG